MNKEEKEIVDFLKFSLLDYEELDTGVLEYIDEKKKKVLNYIKKLQKENKYLKEQLQISNSLDNMYNLYISKDKIRDKIKEIEENEPYNTSFDIAQLATYRELLKEE